MGWLPLVRDTEGAPLGYSAPVLSEDGLSAIQYAIGTPEERAAETLRQWRAARSLPRLDARLRLIAAGLWDLTVAWAADPSRTSAERAFFEDAREWWRLDPMVVSAGAALGLDDTMVDDLFR